MLEYFVDTWFLIARFDRTDAHHEASRAIERRLGDARLISHEAVATEFLSYVAGFGPYNRQRGVDAVRQFMRVALVLPSDHELFVAAINFYDNRLDKHYSLVDCMSMLVMRDYGLTHVLTNDHHFRQEGFTVVSE